MPDPRAYRRLAALLRDEITSGILAPGAQLPPIGELRRQHRHSRQTATKAMGVLQKMSWRLTVHPDPGDPRRETCSLI